ncbi:MAG: hypothetical protein HQL95_01790 [Magnetococcales bacterium]|nr:hypothetical protein [Magnetococcales bacterium]
MDLYSALKTVAPALATAFLGPPGGVLASTALNALSDVLGVSHEDLPQAVQSVDAAKLQEAENQFVVRIRELGLQEMTALLQDKADARHREIAVGPHWIMPTLALISVIGMLGILAVVMLGKVPADNTNVGMAIGQISGIAMAVISYYFGSSVDKGGK